MANVVDALSPSEAFQQFAIFLVAIELEEQGLKRQEVVSQVLGSCRTGSSLRTPTFSALLRALTTDDYLIYGGDPSLCNHIRDKDLVSL